MKRKQGKKMDYKKWVIFERDSFTCILCDKPAKDLHHVLPRSQGGLDAPYNLVSLCRCHHDLLHGTIWNGIDLTPEEARQTLIEYLCDYYADKNPTLFLVF